MKTILHKAKISEMTKRLVMINQTKMFIYSVFLFSLPYLSYPQIRKDQIIKDDDLKYKSVQLILPVPVSRTPFSVKPSNILARGTGFFVEYQKNYYLVSNYHVVTGRWWEDTTVLMFRDQSMEFNNLIVSYYSNNADSNIYVSYSLHDVLGERKFLSLPVNRSSKRVALDIAFLPIDSFDKDVKVSPFNLNVQQRSWKLNLNTRLYSYGYSKRTQNDLYSYCDTLYTVGDSVFKNTDKYIFVYNPGNMHGSSGSPVYYKEGKTFHLIGVYFASVPKEWVTSYPEIFYRNYYNNTIGLIVTISYLRESLNLLLKR